MEPIFENLAPTLNPWSRGTIRVVSERKICDSCTNVITQFSKAFPNITIEAVHIPGFKEYARVIKHGQ